MKTLKSGFWTLPLVLISTFFLGCDDVAYQDLTVPMSITVRDENQVALANTPIAVCGIFNFSYPENYFKTREKDYHHNVNFVRCTETTTDARGDALVEMTFNIGAVSTTDGFIPVVQEPTIVVDYGVGFAAQILPAITLDNVTCPEGPEACAVDTQSVSIVATLGSPTPEVCRFFERESDDASPLACLLNRDIYEDRCDRVRKFNANQFYALNGEAQNALNEATADRVYACYTGVTVESSYKSLLGVPDKLHLIHSLRLPQQ